MRSPATRFAVGIEVPGTRPHTLDLVGAYVHDRGRTGAGVYGALIIDKARASVEIGALRYGLAVAQRCERLR